MGFKRDKDAARTTSGGFKRDAAAGGFKRNKTAYDEQGILQQLFDVTNTDTGESYIYGNKPAPSIMADTNRIIADTATRGYADKMSDLNATVPRGQGNELTGGGNAEKTAAARERMPDYLEFPSDVIAAIGSAPYQVGSRLFGAVSGGLEGMADAYGHQKNWVPSAEDTKDIITQGAIGTGAGAAGSELGRWGGKLWNRFKPLGGAKQDLYDAADRAAKRAESGKTVSPASKAKVGRADRMQEAFRANAEGRGGFEDAEGHGRAGQRSRQGVRQAAASGLDVDARRPRPARQPRAPGRPDQRQPDRRGKRAAQVQPAGRPGHAWHRAASRGRSPRQGTATRQRLEEASEVHHRQERRQG